MGTSRTTSIFGFLTALVVLVIFILVIAYGLNHFTIHHEAKESKITICDIDCTKQTEKLVIKDTQ